MVRVKVCCIASIEEARLAVRLGAAALGLVSEMPSGPGTIAESQIAAIAATVPPPIATFLLTSRTDAEGIIDQQKRCGTNVLQLCDRVAPARRRHLRQALPGIALVQVIHVADETAIAEALEAGKTVDALLLDSGNLSLSVKELGGTGRSHDWSISARIVERSPVPVFLAGGLNPDNAREAIRSVRPFGLDLCTGIRTAGNLDRQKLSQFMDAVRASDRP